jgi:uncharacterized protein (TIGR02265 family)
MNEPRLVFDSAVQSLAKGLGENLTPQLKEKLRAVGLDYDRRLLPAYSLEQWTGFLTVIVEHLQPEVELSRGLEQLGEVFMDGFFLSTIGKAVGSLLKLVGPKQALVRMKRNMRNGFNYPECTVTEKAAGDCLLWINETGLMRLHLGHLPPSNACFWSEERQRGH